MVFGIPQKKPARLSRVSEPTIADFERGARTNPQPRTLHDLRTVLEAQGVEFLWSERGAGVMVTG